MRINFVLNGVIRDYLSMLIKVYEGQFMQNVQYPIDPTALEKSFPIPKKQDKLQENMNFNPEFDEENDEDTGQIPEEEQQSSGMYNIYYYMYMDNPFEVFGQAPQTEDNLIERRNKFQNTVSDKIVVVSKEIESSAPSTLYFLSKNNFYLPELRLITDNAEYDNDCDMIVTDNPIILNNTNKYTIKFNRDFNEDIKADMSINKVSDLLNNKEIFNFYE